MDREIAEAYEEFEKLKATPPLLAPPLSGCLGTGEGQRVGSLFGTSAVVEVAICVGAGRGLVRWILEARVVVLVP